MKNHNIDRISKMIMILILVLSMFTKTSEMKICAEDENQKVESTEQSTVWDSTYFSDDEGNVYISESLTADELIYIRSLYSYPNKLNRDIGIDQLKVILPYGVDSVSGSKWHVDFDRPSNINLTWDTYAQFTLEKQKVYCMQPLSNAINGANYHEIDFGDYISNEVIRKELSYISALGYGFNNDYSDEMDWATQLCIWQRLHEWAPSHYPELRNIHSEIKSKMNQIVQRLFIMKTNVSFKGETINLNGVGEENAVILKDMNNVISFYQFNNATSGIRCERIMDESGNYNSLKVWIDNTDITESKIVYDAFYLRGKQVNPIMYNSEISQAVATLGIPDPNVMLLNVKLNKGSLNIAKQDEDHNSVPNTTFVLSESSDMSMLMGTYTTGLNGNVVVNDLIPGTYYIQEIHVPSHLVLDSSIHKVEVKANETSTYTAKNNWVKGKVKLNKEDSNTKNQIAGAVYAIYDDKNREIERLTTIADGYVESGDLRFGEYIMKEIIAPNGYILSNTEFSFSVTSNEQIIELTGDNDRVRGKIDLVKEDSVTGSKAQGEATLNGAVYGLYARHNIVDPANASVIYSANEKVSEFMLTDLNASISDLYLGDYYVKELKAPIGYVLDKAEYDITLVYADQDTPLISVSKTVKDRVIAQAFRIIKVSTEETGEASYLQGAEFTIKAQKDIDAAGSWEKAPIAKNAQGVKAAVLVTDKNGQALSEELPYGTYVVRETKTPDEKYTVDDFIIKITEDSREPQAWRVFNDTDFKAVLQIVKKDKDTGKTILLPNASFKIKNLDTNEYVTQFIWFPTPYKTEIWKTDKEGIVYTNDVLSAGNYQLEEIKAPNGYSINHEPVKFTVTKKGVYEILPDEKTPFITVELSDNSVKGKINVVKHGEVLTDVTTDHNGNQSFIYEEQGIAGAEYTITAAEDIMDPSNDGTILYKQGTVMESLKTGKDGIVESKKYPLGKYEVKETKAPNGFVLNDEPHIVNLAYKDQDTAVVFENVVCKNERQKVALSIIKKDKISKHTLSGAVFGLYAKTDIKNAKGEVVINANELIMKTTSTDDGLVAFMGDLPLSTYFAKEIQAPIGYATSKEIVDFDATYQGQDVNIIEYIKEFLNEITKVNVSKKDITNHEEVAGAHLKVYPKKEPGAIFASWISGQDGKNEDGSIKPHVVEGLEVGKTYILEEMSSPYGYAIAKNVEFTVKDTGNIQMIEMKDDVVMGQLKWKKTGEIFNQTITGQTEFGSTESPVWNKSSLLGAEITIYAANDISIGNHLYYKADEAIQVLTSDWDEVLSKELPVGMYYYQETKVPHGYIIDTNKYFFEVKDNQIHELQIIVSTLANKRAIIDIDMKKTLERQNVFKNSDAYKDIVFGIFAREDIYDYLGNVAIPYGTMLYTSGIDSNGHLEQADNFDLPIGVYYVKELSTNEQYVLNDTEYDFEIAYHGENVAKYTVQIGKDGTIDNALARGTIHVQKVDTLNPKSKLKNVEFNISINENMSNVLDTIKTDENGIASFENVELGTYYIQEVKQINGYVINDHIYKVDVATDGDVLEINCENKPTEMTFSKVGETGTEELEGAKLQVIEKETGTIIEEWTSENEAHEIHYLVEGREYVMKEVIAPYGYEVAEEISFVAGDGQNVKMKDSKIRTMIHINKVDSTTKKAITSKDIEFTLFKDAECKETLNIVKANVETGTATFELLYGEWWIKETKAPVGYQLSDEVKHIVINDKGVFVNDKKLKNIEQGYSFEYENKQIAPVKTGDTRMTLLYEGMGSLSLFVIITMNFIKFKRKKHEQ